MHGATTTLAKMGLTVTLEAGRDACADSIVGFLGAVDGLSEHALLDVSRCYGWARLDVVVHVVAGWQEMLGGMVATVDAAPTVDAATYWPAFAKEFATDDEVPTLMSQRRRTAIHTRPSTAVAQLHDVGAALLHGVRSFEDRPRLWQGQCLHGRRLPGRVGSRECGARARPRVRPHTGAPGAHLGPRHHRGDSGGAAADVVD